MKKSALLAVSALSLGVVGLATFTPVVNAATTASGNASVTVTVGSAIGIGGETVEEGGTNNSIDMTEYNVNFNTVTAGNVAAEQSVTVVTTNNTGTPGTLYISAADTNLKSGGDTIPAGPNIAEGTSAWAYKVDDGAFQAVTTSQVQIDTDSGSGTNQTALKFGLSTANDQATGQYNGSVTYTYTVQ